MFAPQAPYRRSATNATSIACLAGDLMNRKNGSR